MFRRLSIPPTTCEDPLTWWCYHEKKFPNVAFMAKHILGILWSQIETKRIFNLVRVLIALWRCHLQVENLDRIMTIVKNWLDDPRVNCMPSKTMKDYLKSLVDDNYELIEKVEYFGDLNVDDD